MCRVTVIAGSCGRRKVSAAKPTGCRHLTGNWSFRKSLPWSSAVSRAHRCSFVDAFMPWRRGISDDSQRVADSNRRCFRSSSSWQLVIRRTRRRSCISGGWQSPLNQSACRSTSNQLQRSLFSGNISKLTFFLPKCFQLLGSFCTLCTVV